MSDKLALTLDWCSYAAAKHAVEHWHYSRVCPVGKQVRVGVWEHGCFSGVVLFMRGGNNHLLSPYGLIPWQGVELIRVALIPSHQTPTSRIVCIAVKLMKKANPGLRLIVSYADPVHGHHGGIYQALGWVYTGLAAGFRQYYLKGKWYHERSIRWTSQWSSVQGADVTNVPSRTLPGKHRYLHPLDDAMRAQIQPLAQPYPKRATSILADAPAVQVGESGAAPTVALAP